MKYRRVSIIAVALAFSVCMGVLFSVHSQAANAPSLFHNDEKWYRDSTVGLEIVSGVYYVPVDIFGMFNQIELSVDSRRGEFMLYNRRTERYISVLYDEKMATVNGEEEIYLNLYRLHGGYFYVPVEYFCSVLSLNCETQPSSNTVYGVTLRISDGSETKTLAELLNAYDAVFSVDSTTESGTAKETDAPDTSETFETDTVFRTDYLTFNTVSADTFEDVMAALHDAGVQATVFFTEAEMRAYPERLITAVAEGHTIALTCASATSAEDFLLQMNHANALLYSIAKIQTRIAQLPGGTDASGWDDAELAKIQENGYALWDWTYDVPDSVGYAAGDVASLCRQAIGQSEINILRMSCNRTVADILPGLLQYLKSQPNHTVRAVSAAGAAT